MRVTNISNQNFKARLVNFKPLIDSAAKQGMSKTSIERALNKIHQIYPHNDTSVMVAYPLTTTKPQVQIGILNKERIFRFMDVPLAAKKTDLYRVISAIKKLSNAEFTKELDFKIFQ